MLNDHTTPNDHSPPTGPQPVPVGLFLVPPRPRTPGDGRRGSGHASGLAASGLAASGLAASGLAAPGRLDWNGLSPADLAYVIRRYTRFGDVVLDLDAHPSVIEAARYLRRAAARLVESRHGPRVRLVPPPAGRWPRRVARRPGAGANLILVTLPRAGAYSLDLHGMTRAMSAWRSLLRPGGHLIAALTANSPQPGKVGHRSTVIAAARAAGLRYHQHIPVVLIALPEHEPRSEPERVGDADDGRRLLAGRHLPAFRDVLVFAGTATGEEAHGA